ncbi:ROK family protein [Virgibacillus halodenitrificans]|uniref:ROK family protein n=1 Tax=Virgibacillus halodenitrificans TaxID=1482 RepID=A0ABR7VH79_VIRHA|nr:ROK family protein [Virgibacillus halodenitrificans]MBD1221036.1 ROK family protein [Virgibacillus halodenitrificans]MCG1030230.1 ROK family protein [Virgibacillus halodenitrificans]CDQ31127.1 Beta-glucoside kinase [Virgibacillus halodenitrificans]
MIVIDIGGTAIKFGVLTKDGELLYHDSKPTEAHQGGMALVQRILDICDELSETWKVSGIAISTAGQIDSTNGLVVHATDTIPGYTGIPIAQLVSEHTGLPVSVENDVNCTAIGEHWKGAARGYDDFICVTIGTGIGGALFMNGKLYTGTNFSAGEFGHINLYKDGKPCTCGNNGCYERYASSAALAELVAESTGNKKSLPDFFQLVREENASCVNIFESWVDDLTTGLQSLVHIFNPELIVIGGGITAQGDLLLNAIESSLYDKLMPNHRKKLSIKLAENDNKANLLGAAKHFMDKYE